MSKKRFTVGLESVFGGPSEDRFAKESPLLKEKKKKKNRVVGNAASRNINSKNFTSDLDSLFEDALKETIVEKAKKMTKGLDEHDISTKKRNRRPYSGLDALIRNTSEQVVQEKRSIAASREAEIKRVTFVCEAEKLQQLKKIARKENTYLKDILGDIVTQYVEKYGE